MTGRHPHWDVPLLDRMRSDFEALTARDAQAQAGQRRPRRRPGPALAVAALLLLLAVVLVVDRTGPDAVASVRDAPAAAARAGSYMYRTVTALRSPGGQGRSVQVGSVNLRRGSFSAQISAEGPVGVERIGVGGKLFFRASRRSAAGGGGWQRVDLGAPAVSRLAREPATAAPVSSSAIRALAVAKGEVVVNDHAQIDGVRVTHYRLDMDASTFLGTSRTPDRAALAQIDGRLDIWLDSAQRPRRIRARFVSPTGSASFVLDTTYSAYGSDPPISAPRASQPALSRPLVTDPVAANMTAVFGS